MGATPTIFATTFAAATCAAILAAWWRCNTAAWLRPINPSLALLLGCRQELEVQGLLAGLWKGLCAAEAAAEDSLLRQGSRGTAAASKTAAAVEAMQLMRCMVCTSLARPPGRCLQQLDQQAHVSFLKQLLEGLPLVGGLGEG